jgi:hypothetical protein
VRTGAGSAEVLTEPSTNRTQGWHQDYYTEIVPQELVSAWTAIDAATEASGCMYFIPGSHRWGPVDDVGGPPFWLNAGNNPSNNVNGREVSEVASSDETVDGWRTMVPVVLQPGDVSFHHSLLLHCSGFVVRPAVADVPVPRRRGYSVHYMRASSVRRGPPPQGCLEKYMISNGNPLTGMSGKPYQQIRGRSFQGRV